MLEREESVPCMVEIYKNKRSVIINGARNAPTELEMEGFVMIIILKVSFNQKQANKENGVLGFSSIFY
jgi:hypothetical protein